MCVSLQHSNGVSEFVEQGAGIDIRGRDTGRNLQLRRHRLEAEGFSLPAARPIGLK
jgi:hypothetical protein